MTHIIQDKFEFPCANKANGQNMINLQTLNSRVGESVTLIESVSVTPQPFQWWCIFAPPYSNKWSIPWHHMVKCSVVCYSLCMLNASRGHAWCQIIYLLVLPRLPVEFPLQRFNSWSNKSDEQFHWAPEDCWLTPIKRSEHQQSLGHHPSVQAW